MRPWARRSWARAALAWALVATAACGDDVVTIRDGEAVVLEVEVGRAVTAAERMEGLAGRSLGPGEGLLLVFPFEDEVCIANGDVAFPIDVLFIEEDATVGALERGFPAGDGVPRCATARWVLEVPAGDAAAVTAGMIASGL